MLIPGLSWDIDCRQVIVMIYESTLTCENYREESNKEEKNQVSMKDTNGFLNGADPGPVQTPGQLKCKLQPKDTKELNM